MDETKKCLLILMAAILLDLVPGIHWPISRSFLYCVGRTLTVLNQATPCDEPDLLIIFQHAFIGFKSSDFKVISRSSPTFRETHRDPLAKAQGNEGESLCLQNQEHLRGQGFNAPRSTFASWNCLLV